MLRSRLKKTVAAAALLLSAIATGYATEVRSGYWTVFDTKGVEGKFRPLCGMKTSYADVRASIFIKYILGTKVLTVHIFKEGWRFPADKPINFPITVGFDKEAFGSTTASGIYQPQAGPMIEFYIANESIENFLKDFGNASWLWIKFDEGSEKPWPAKMEGSRNAASMFSRCIVNLIDANSTQPYGKPETQPYSNSATQPFNSQTQPYSAAPPSQPNNGAPKAGKPLTLPSAKKDDGSI
jgi:hypothetical protein